MDSKSRPRHRTRNDAITYENALKANPAFASVEFHPQRSPTNMAMYKIVVGFKPGRAQTRDPAMKALKAFFLSRLMREKALLLAFVGLGAAIWLFNYVGRATSFRGNISARRQRSKSKRAVIVSGPATEAAAKKAIAQLDPAKTLNATSLLATIHESRQDAHLDSGRMEDQNDEPARSSSCTTCGSRRPRPGGGLGGILPENPATLALHRSRAVHASGRPRQPSANKRRVPVAVHRGCSLGRPGAGPVRARNFRLAWASRYARFAAA